VYSKPLDRMPNLSHLIAHWGYAAIFFVVVLGNLGLPVPEETIIGLSGYLAWRGELSFSIVVVVGILSGVTGDNTGYWLGRKHGKKAIEYYATKIMTPERVVSAERLVKRYGVYGIFLARFIPVARFMAGPISGAIGLKFWGFFVANFLGAALYVPLVATLGYGVGYGLGPRIEELRYIIGQVEHLVLAGAGIMTMFWMIRRVRKKKSFSK